MGVSTEIKRAPLDLEANSNLKFCFQFDVSLGHFDTQSNFVPINVGFSHLLSVLNSNFHYFFNEFLF